MVIPAWIPSWSPFVGLVVILVVGIFINRRTLALAVRTIHTEKAFSSDTPPIPRAQINLAPHGQVAAFDEETFKEGFEQLVRYAEETKPDWLLGVHPGGRFLSVLLAERLKIAGDRCLYIRTTSSDANKVVLESKHLTSNFIGGRMLVIDDISRTGDTLNVVKSFLMKKNYCETFLLDKVRFAVMVVVSEKESEYEFRPDFVSYKTPNNRFRLPWSKYSTNVQAQFDLKRSKRPYDAEVIQRYLQMIVDYEAALAMARRLLHEAWPRKGSGYGRQKALT
jgi:hypoxanthine phosphoribosyltransferase